MNFKIEHRIAYQYSEKVFLEPIVLRLVPRTNAFQRLLDFSLEIQPQPAGLTEGNDLEGCPAHYMYFSGEHDQLSILARSNVQTLKLNPFDFILSYAQCNQLPLSYPEPLAEALEPYAEKPEFNDALINFTKEILDETGGDTLKFLIRLTSVIHERFGKNRREEGHPLSAIDVLEQGSGACRDLTKLYMEICRHLGLAARYVSGYTLGDANLIEGELHAWAEVYLPGGGWRGYDPTLGLAVADQHIVLTTNLDPQWTLPLTGSIRSKPGSQAKMTYGVRVETY